MKITPREADVLKLLLQGSDNKEIATELKISPGTVKSHLRVLCLRARINSGSKRTKLALVYRAILAEPSPVAVYPRMTPREEEIFRLVAEGKSNTEIASAVGHSVQVTKNFLRTLFDKFGVWNRTELALKSTETVYVA
jgi:DNA-binding NarL/FixJ family response regulator